MRGTRGAGTEVKGKVGIRRRVPETKRRLAQALELAIVLFVARNEYTLLKEGKQPMDDAPRCQSGGASRGCRGTLSACRP